MRTRIDLKKLALASVAVFLAISVLEYFLQRIYFIPSFPGFFPETAGETGSLLPRILTHGGRLLFSVLFVYLFVKGWEGKPGLGEGVRFGFWISLVSLIPIMLNTIVTSEFTTDFVLVRSGTWIVELVLCGGLVNWFYRGERQKS